MWQSLVTIGQATSEIRRRKDYERKKHHQHFIRPTRPAIADGRHNYLVNLNDFYRAMLAQSAVMRQ